MHSPLLNSSERRTTWQGAILIPNSRLAHGNGLYSKSFCVLNFTETLPCILSHSVPSVLQKLCPVYSKSFCVLNFTETLPCILSHSVSSILQKLCPVYSKSFCALSFTETLPCILKVILCPQFYRNSALQTQSHSVSSVLQKLCPVESKSFYALN